MVSYDQYKNINIHKLRRKNNKVYYTLRTTSLFFSHCKEHSWDYERKIVHSSKYSIFSASGSDDEELEAGEK